MIVAARILAQMISTDVKDWDCPILEWIQSLVGVKEFAIPRHLNYTSESQLLVFCDASCSAYGCIAYLRTQLENGEIVIRMIMSKAKAAPKTPLSIPCAELTAAVLGIRLAQLCLRTIKVRDVKYFYDSTDVLWWIQGRGTNCKPYVEHRMGEIQMIHCLISGTTFVVKTIRQISALVAVHRLSYSNQNFGPRVPTG